MNKDLVKGLISVYKLVNDGSLSIATKEKVYDNVTVDDVGTEDVELHTTMEMFHYYVDFDDIVDIQISDNEMN